MTRADNLSETRFSCMTALFVAIISPKISALHIYTFQPVNIIIHVHVHKVILSLKCAHASNLSISFPCIHCSQTCINKHISAFSALYSTCVHAYYVNVRACMLIACVQTFTHLFIFFDEEGMEL